MSHPAEVEAAMDFISNTFKYDMQDPQLVAQAIITKGMTWGLYANKDLAIIGDAALSLVLKVEGYRAGVPRARTSELSQTMLSNNNFADIARRMNLGRYLILNTGHMGPPSPATLSTGLGAVFGAIYLDSGENNGAVRASMIAIGMEVHASPA